MFDALLKDMEKVNLSEGERSAEIAKLHMKRKDASPEEQEAIDVELGKLEEVDKPVEASQEMPDITWDGLEAHISELLGISAVTVSANVSNKGYVQWEVSGNFVEQTGIFKSTMSNVTIEAFSTSRVDEVAKNNKYWCTAHIHFDLTAGGSNGIQLFSAWYDLATKQWTFR